MGVGALSIALLEDSVGNRGLGRMETRRRHFRRGPRWAGPTYALLHEDAELALILNLDELLATVSRVGAMMD